MAIVASQEPSSSTFRYNYQVFLSFRGEDTRKNFTDHLYTALDQAGLRTFRDDDEIERGKRLEIELCKGIQQSRISIIVLSKNYASSKWCLDEVVMILKCSRSSSRGHEVLPVFYDVRPSDVRNQTGSIGEAFARYEEELIDGEIDDEKKKEWMEKVKCWKLALREVANLTGMVLQNQANGHEAKFIQEIVKEVEHKLNRAVLYVGRHLVGMDSRAENIDSWVQNGSSSEDVLVICGMGGIGKTTIAKFVYNLNFQRFEGSCFLASVKEKSQQLNGLVNLQAQLLSSILKGKRKEIYDVDEGIIKINEAICCKRILVVIDDVDEVEHLDALLGTRELYPGSKLIITTRNKSLLKPHEVHRLHAVPVLNSYESLELFCLHAFGNEHRLHAVPVLNFYESLELFCLHAFGNEHPIKDCMELLLRAIHHCSGLPLAHKILGSSLAGKSKKVWASMLDKLEAIPETKIQNVFKISFDSLQDDHDRNLFLHVACFFVGHKKDETIEILDACDFFTVCGIENLIDRCLISIDEDCNLMMHQLLQEMGRQIVDQESPKDPGRRSRLWRPMDSFVVLNEKKGTETIEGLMLDMRMYKVDAFNAKKRYFNFISSESSSEADFNYDTFSKMNRLRLLKLNYARLCGCSENFTEGLRWLCWHGFPSKYIPFDLPLGNLVSLDMSYSKLEHIWAESKVLLSLKILNLSHSLWLLETPNFKGLPNLEKLILIGCVSLFEVGDTIGNLERLVLLNLRNCESLRKFPNIGMLKLLQTLVLDGCSSISEFPKNLKNMESLKALSANGVTINPLASTSKDHVKPILKNPQHLCVSFPHTLVSLNLQNCNLSDDDFPLDFSNLSMLKELDLSYNLFLNLPRCIGNLRKLSKLDLVACRELHSISGLPEVGTLLVDNCRSLESVTYQSALTKPSIFSFGCGKLREVQGMFKLEPMERVNREILNNLGLCGVDLFGKLRLNFTFWSTSSNPYFEIEECIHQGLYEFGIFSTFLRRDEIQRWFSNINNNSNNNNNNNNNNNKGASSSVSFVVPSHPNLRIRGLNVYSLYTLLTNQVPETNGIVTPYLLFAKINNKTKDFKWIYCPVTLAITKKENNEEEFLWLSHWKFGNHLESGDVVDVSVISGSEALEVKEFGINLVWGEELDMKSNTHHNDNTKEVIGGDLSNYQFMNPRAFFLCHHSIHFYFTDAWARKNWFRQVFGDHATAKDYKRWIWGKQIGPKLC